MSSLIFRALDQQVVGGLADESALTLADATMSYAQLLHESASIAGALQQMGVEAGDAVGLEGADRRVEVVGVLACARLGAVPSSAGTHRFVGEPPVLQTPETEVPWDVLLRAGRNDPATAPASDPDGYEQQMLADHADVFETLLAGGTIRL